MLVLHCYILLLQNIHTGAVYLHHISALSGKVKEEKIKEKTKLQENHGKPF